MDCLVTKLRASVADDSLTQLGVLRLTLKPKAKSTDAISGTGCKLSLVSGNISVTDVNTGAAMNPPFAFTSGYKNIVVGEDGAVVDISNKYEITNLEAIAAVMQPTPFSHFFYCDKLTTMNDFDGFVSGVSAMENGFVGDVADLAKFPKLARLRLRNKECIGDVANLGNLLSLTYLELNGDALTGKMEDMVARYRKNGKTSGTLSLGYLATGVSFNGNAMTLDESSKLEWTASTITWNGKTITA